MRAFQSVEVLSAPSVATETRYFHLFYRKLVIVSQLFAAFDRPQGKDHDVFPPVDEDHFRVAVRLTRMVDEPCGVPHHRGIDDVVGVFPEHVASDATGLITPLPLISQRRPDHLAGVLDYHLTGVEVSATEQSSAVDRRRIDTNGLTCKCSQVSETHGHRQIQTRRPPEQQCTFYISRAVPCTQATF